jgi:hypothetical protein
VTTHGRYTGILRDDLSYAFDADAQDFPGIDFSSGLYRANMRRLQATANQTAFTTQTMKSTPLFLRAGDVVTNLTFVSATTAAGTPTNWWFALYSSAATPALLGQTADQTTTAWAAYTAMTKALASPVTITTTGWHWAAISVKASTVPTLLGSVAFLDAVMANPIITGEKVLAQTSGSSLTDTAPATIASPTTALTVPYVIAT